MPRWVGWLIRGMVLFAALSLVAASIASFDWFAQPVGRVFTWIAVAVAAYVWILTDKLTKSES